MQRLRAIWAGGWIGKVAIIGGGLVGVLVVCCAGTLILGALVSPSAPTASSTPGTTAQANVATEVPALAATDAPTAIPAPTNTPDPTATPEPTAIPTEVPTPTPLPEPVVIKGSGQTVTDPFTPPSTVNRITASHQGRRNFALKAYTPDGKSDLLINTIGAYQGVVLLMTDQEIFFEVDADGAWSLQVEVITFDETAAQGAAGKGDYVSGLFMPATEGAIPYTFTHNGERNFAVFLHCAGGRELAQNEIGPVDNQAVVRFREGPCLWQVQADGEWSVKPK